MSLPQRQQAVKEAEVARGGALGCSKDIGISHPKPAMCPYPSRRSASHRVSGVAELAARLSPLCQMVCAEKLLCI